jgi:hypothetical protein
VKYKEISEACWTGYQQQGMKKKGDRQVPNCVPVEEVKTGPEITGRDLLFKAAAMAMRDASHEGISLDYEQAIRQASKIYGIPYQPSELPKLLAQRAEIDRQLALLKQGKQVAKQRRREKLAPTPAGAEEYWKSHALPTDRIKPASKTLEAIEEDLKKWFKEKWVRFGPDGKIRGDCARGSSKEGKPKCLPQSKAHALGKKGRASAAAKKRREDPNPERRGPAKNVATRVKETVTDVKAGMAEIYHRLAPKIERYRDSFLAGQLYDELENYAELHGAEGEFKRMMATARGRAHMEYDTNPGGFHNWFWFLPFEDSQLEESTDDIKKRMSKLEALALAANRAGDDAKCKMYQQKIQALKQKLSQSMSEAVNVNPQFINAQVTKILAGEARRMTNAPMAQLLAPVMKEYGLSLQQIDSMVPGGLKKASGEYGIMMKEGWSDAIVAQRTGRPRTPYSVYIKGKKWKDFENDDHAEAVANKLRAKFKADGRDPGVITIAPTDIPEGVAEAVTLDRTRVPDYPRDPATVKHRTDTAKSILSDPRSDTDSRREASAILAALKQVDEEQDACYRKVKSRYKVWPSAYASGALVQCRKKGAANWGNKTKK